MDGRLGKAPVGDARHVLDVATGTGIWVTQYGTHTAKDQIMEKMLGDLLLTEYRKTAQQHPHCQVIGTDLSQIQKEHSAPNCKFIRQDAENEEWNFDQKFDYIYFRYVVSCFNDMPAVMKKAFDCLAPGGWVEFYDTSPVMVTLDDTFRGTAAERWNQALLKGGLRAGRDLLKAQKYAGWCKSIGFVDVTEELFPLPSNGKWPKNPKMKEIGKHTMKNLMGLVDSLTKFLELSGLSPEEISDLKREAKRDIQDGAIHFCAQMYVMTRLLENEILTKWAQSYRVCEEASNGKLEMA